MKNAILAIAATAALGGCLGGVGGGDLVTPGTATGTLNLINNSGATFTVVTISECSALSHGFTRLNSGETVRSGASRAWTVSAGCWDVQAGYPTSGGYVASDDRINIPAGQTFNLTIN